MLESVVAIIDDMILAKRHRPRPQILCGPTDLQLGEELVRAEMAKVFPDAPKLAASICDQIESERSLVCRRALLLAIDYSMRQVGSHVSRVEITPEVLIIDFEEDKCA